MKMFSQQKSGLLFVFLMMVSSMANSQNMQVACINMVEPAFQIVFYKTKCDKNYNTQELENKLKNAIKTNTLILN